ncbi:hypothetical protein SDC9_141906 [bioreactor metagenome]|uniref:Uncharacterized protein n=1 Tax=bioreactor metagenome TaxID=1076179 RepID=A0A645E052_9ZZZZ
MAIKPIAHGLCNALGSKGDILAPGVGKQAVHPREEHQRDTADRKTAHEITAAAERLRPAHKKRGCRGCDALDDIVKRKARYIRRGIGKRGGEQNAYRCEDDIAVITLHQLAYELPVCLFLLWLFLLGLRIFFLHNISCGFTSTMAKSSFRCSAANV